MTAEEIRALLATNTLPPDRRRKLAEQLRVLELDQVGVVQERVARIQQMQDRIRAKINAGHPRSAELANKLERLEEDRQLLAHLDGAQSIRKQRRERDLARTKAQNEGRGRGQGVMVAPPAGGMQRG